MPFDGVHYTAAPIIQPYAYHPYAPATADVLSGALLQSYFHAQNSALLVGVQTYQGALNIGAYFTATANAILTSGFVDLAHFRRAKPTYYTHVNFIACFRMFAAQGVFVEHRISAYDEVVNTETSVSFEQTMQPVPHAALSGGPYDPAAAMIGTQYGNLDITSLTGSFGGFVVSAQARDDAEANAEYYRPEMIICWLSVEG